MSIQTASSDDTRIDSSVGSARSASTRIARAVALSRRNPAFAASAAIILVFLVLAVIPDAFTQYDPVNIQPQIRLEGPSSDHYFGTDHLGRDIYTRVIHGTRTSLAASAIVVLFAAVIGINIGAIAGYSSRWLDEVIMRIVDLFLAFPLLVLALAIVAALGPGLRNAMIALIVVWWAQYARLTRGLVLQIREREHVLAAQAIGASRIRILYRHILPNSSSPLLVKATLDIAVAVLVTASLSFLGLGVQPPDPDWGGMVSDGRAFIIDAWWYPTFPGLAIFLVVMTLNLIGDSIRDILDPRIQV